MKIIVQYPTNEIENKTAGNYLNNILCDYTNGDTTLEDMEQLAYHLKVVILMQKRAQEWADKDEVLSSLDEEPGGHH